MPMPHVLLELAVVAGHLELEGVGGGHLQVEEEVVAGHPEPEGVGASGAGGGGDAPSPRGGGGGGAFSGAWTSIPNLRPKQ